MKKEAINTFSEGLNYDLNPITTPNNVLTDCINGTFITFNGDELALQNDAGNTKIKSPDGGYVKLSDGFYPLAVKEYGGVLYIVSGKKIQIDDNILDWVPNNPYSVGDIVRYNDKYYLNDLENNMNPINSEFMLGEIIDGEILLTENNELMLSENGWTSIVLDSDNYTRLIEFGSYPSPEFSGATSNSGIVYSAQRLYDPIIINNQEFKSGRYVKFPTSPGFDSTYFSYKALNGTYIKRLYKVKLWHQLNNGMLDITNDVIEKYHKFRLNKSSTSDYWFNEPTFTYFCPNQYKGKLAMSVELEPITIFKLSSVPELTYDGTNYNLSVKVSVNYGTSSIVTIPSVTTRVYVGSVLQGTDITTTVDAVTKIADVLISLPQSTYNNKIIRYEIIPNIAINGVLNTVAEYNNFPYEFTSQYVVKGERLLTSTEADIVFELAEGICDSSGNGMHTYQVAILKNSLGQFIDTTYAISTEGPHAFMLSGYDNPTYIKVGTYTITTSGDEIGKPQVSVDGLTVSESVAQLFHTSTIVYSYKEECKQVIATINFSEDMNPIYGFTISQNGQTLPVTTVTAKQYTCSVSQGISFTINVSKEGFLPITISKSMTTASTINLALLADIYLQTIPGTDVGIWDQYAYWRFYTPDIASIAVTTNSGASITMLPNELQTMYSGFKLIRKDYSGVILTVMSGTTYTGEGNYDNLAENPSLFKVYNGHYFWKNYSLDWNIR